MTLPSRAVAAAVTPADVLFPIGAVGVAVLLGVAVSALVTVLVARGTHPEGWRTALGGPLRAPLRAALVVVGVWTVLHWTTDEAPWRRAADRVLAAALVVAVAWAIGALVVASGEAAARRARAMPADEPLPPAAARRLRPLRRATVAVLAPTACAVVLVIIPATRGAGLFVLGAVAVGLLVVAVAAREWLAGVAAGLTLATADAVRVGDVVALDGRWGRVEELSTTLVVLRLWDERRLVVPATKLVREPFETWTRRSARPLGVVDLDLGWTVPMGALRTELTRLVSGSDLWDGRVAVLQVADAVGGLVRVRAMVSAADAATSFDLCAHVREGLVAWVQREAPGAVPHSVGVVVPAAPPSGPAARGSVEQGPDGGAPAEHGADGGAPTEHGADTPVPTEHDADGPGPGPERDSPAVTPPDLAGAAAVPAWVPADRPRRPRPRVETPASPTGVLPPPGGWADQDTQALEQGAGDAHLFTGTIDALDRAQAFWGPAADVLDDRERIAGAADDEFRPSSS